MSFLITIILLNSIFGWVFAFICWDGWKKALDGWKKTIDEWEITITRYQEFIEELEKQTKNG